MVPCNLTQHRSIASFIVARPGRARIFDYYAIDYSVDGKQILKDICLEQHIDISALLRELDDFDKDFDEQRIADTEPDWSSATITELIHDIEKTHHAYLRKTLPYLSSQANKIAGSDNRRQELANLAAGLQSEKEAHMDKEEAYLFPMLRRIDHCDMLPDFRCMSLKNPITLIDFDHHHLNKILSRMHRLMTDCAVLESGGASAQQLSELLKELEADMRLHLHKENNLLFPMAMAAQEMLKMPLYRNRAV